MAGLAAVNRGISFSLLVPKIVQLTRSPRVRRVLRRALVVVLGAYVLYLVLANVFLGFHLLDRVATSDDGTVELRTGRAWSLWPGRASVRDFVLRLDSDDLQLRLTVAKATTSVSLWRLLRHQVSLSDVEAEGTSFRLRMRVESIPPEDKERIAAYPEIEGALGPPLFSAAKKVPKSDPEDAWHVDITDAKVAVDEVWIQEYRLTGDIGVAGSFALWPGKDFVLLPSAVTIGKGDVRVGSHGVTSDLEIPSAIAEITRVPLPETHGNEVLRYLTASARGSSTTDDGSFLDVYPDIPQVRTEPSRSRFEARFDKGRFVRGTSALLEARNTVVRGKGFAMGASALVRLSVPQDGDIELGADSGSGWVTIEALPSTKEAPWKVHDSSVRQLIHVAVGEPFSFGLGAYRGGLRTPTLGWFEDLANIGAKTRGRAIGTIDLVRDGNGKITGPFSATLEDAWVSGDTIAVAVSSTARGKLALEPNPKDGIAITGVRVDAPRASVQANGRSQYTTWFRADVPSVTIKLAPRFEVRAAADLAAGTGGLVAGIVEAQAGIVLGPIAAHFIDGPGMAVRGGIAVAGKDITVEVPRAKVGSVDSKGFWMRYGTKSRLAFLLEDPPLSVGVRIGDGVPLVLPTVGEGWLAEQRP